MSKSVEFPTPMVAQLGSAARKRYHTAKLEGLSDQAAFEEIVRAILECYAEAKDAIVGGKAKP